MNGRPTAAAAGKIDVGGDLTVNRLGFGAMRITGPGIWGDPLDRGRAIQALRRAVELDVTFIDTADSYGPEVSERLIAEATRNTSRRTSGPPAPSSPPMRSRPSPRLR
jgi:pyridoxine 4-dehydrogenase